MAKDTSGIGFLRPPTSLVSDSAKRVSDTAFESGARHRFAEPGTRTYVSPRYVLRTSGFSRERLRVVGERDLARLEHVAAVRDVERHQRVLLDEQDRRALLVHS